MQFEFESHTLHIEFGYGRLDLTHKYGLVKPGGTSDITWCTIFAHEVHGTIDTPTHIKVTVASGKAQRHFKDSPNRDTGRKLSLARALEAAANGRMWGPFGLYPKSRVKAFKRAAWTAYLNRKSKPSRTYTTYEVEEAMRRALSARPEIQYSFPLITNYILAELTGDPKGYLL